MVIVVDQYVGLSAMNRQQYLVMDYLLDEKTCETTMVMDVLQSKVSDGR
jgi:hypothetical protein